MTIKNIHFNILIGLNSFIIFFLFFEDNIKVPVYLQVVGRMHPLVLHFPIVLLIISWVLLLFRRRLEQQIPSFKSVIDAMVYGSALLLAITVIMGLLLSQEGGYEGNTYDWHKYTGVALSLLTLALVGYARYRQADRYHRGFVVGMNISLLLLLLVGHFGAELTHGENFITAPLMGRASKALDVEGAIVFEDVILPVLQAKCVSCHNNNKPKGGLILTDSAAILKGGKNGKAFIAGNPLNSMMIERILLDLDHQHRMPPKGKPQLSADEIMLLKAWVTSGAKFNVPLSAFREQDTLYQAIKTIYGFQTTESYDFGAADDALIEKLTTPYRIINPLDAGSPALNVNFYGKDFYTEESLRELLRLSEQVVSINLSSMPVKRADLEILKNFKHLRTLNLNNTKLQNTDIMLLSVLPNLKSVSVIGTGITVDGLKEIAKIPTLRKLYVWNTALKEADLEGVRKEFPILRIDGGSKGDDNLKLELTVPKISPARSFFKKQVEVSLSHPIAGVEIRYTLDGSNPDSATALIYKSAFVIEKDVSLRVKAIKDGWLPSTEAKQYFYNAPITPQRISLDHKPHHLFKARKEQTFFDLESGGNNHADGKWMGFQATALSAKFSFDAPARMDTLAISIKQQYNQHIYPPEFVEVWGGVDSLHVRLLNKVRIPLDKIEHARATRIITCPIPDQTIGFIHLKIQHHAKIPEGYPGGGFPPWLFVDEIVIK